MIRPPPSPLSVVDQKSPGQIGLRVPVIKSRDQTNMRKNISVLIRFLVNPNSCFTETHRKKTPIATCNMKPFVVLVGGFQPLPNVSKKSI